jgi:hypothetical protein
MDCYSASEKYNVSANIFAKLTYIANIFVKKKIKFPQSSNGDGLLERIIYSVVIFIKIQNNLYMG